MKIREKLVKTPKIDLDLDLSGKIEIGFLP